MRGIVCVCAEGLSLLAVARGRVSGAAARAVPGFFSFSFSEIS